ncbi:MAG TPA: hypothetical protein O0W90_03275 [Methanocorpusculum sp.]|nr:hypothetical protein [Methanocorpusculum sp.]
MTDDMTEDEINEDFDLVIPPGTPRKIIAEIIKKFDVELVDVVRTMNYANMVNDEREILAFRGKKDVINEANEYLISEIHRFIDTGMANKRCE